MFGFKKKDKSEDKSDDSKSETDEVEATDGPATQETNGASSSETQKPETEEQGKEKDPSLTGSGGIDGEKRKWFLKKNEIRDRSSSSPIPALYTSRESIMLFGALCYFL